MPKRRHGMRVIDVPRRALKHIHGSSRHPFLAPGQPEMFYHRVMALSDQAEAVLAATPHAGANLEQARDRLIVALDVRDAASAIDLVSRLEGCCRWFKVGRGVFT